MSTPLEEVGLSTDAHIEAVSEILETLRHFLDMDVAFITLEYPNDIGAKRLFMSGRVGHAPSEASLALADLYCEQIKQGNLPPMITDTRDMPLTKRTACTTDDAIRSIIARPLSLEGGQRQGTICCFADRQKPSLTQRDLKAISMLSRLIANALGKYLDRAETFATAVITVQNVINTNAFEIYLQPIVSLTDHMPMAVEALCRFTDASNRDPLSWFKLAEVASLSKDLELAAINRALTHLPDLPEGMYMTLNAGPQTVCAPELMTLLADVPADRVVVELTEHHVIHDLPQLQSALADLRARRIGIAVDDVGAGYAGLSTVLQLRPDVLKLDRDLVCGIENDPAKQALTTAMIHFATETNAFLVAEGVETDAEDAMLRSLGLRLGQGFLYSRPAPAADQMTLMHMQREGRRRRASRTKEQLRVPAS